jgi:hypothetical protein
MDQRKMKEQFLACAEADKVMIMLHLMYNMTIVIRDIFHERSDDVKLKSSYVVSEINHQITSYVIATMLNEARYPDDVIFDIIINKFNSSDIKGYLTKVWDASVQSLSDGKARPANPV